MEYIGGRSADWDRTEGSLQPAKLGMDEYFGTLELLRLAMEAQVCLHTNCHGYSSPKWQLSENIIANHQNLTHAIVSGEPLEH